MPTPAEIDEQIALERDQIRIGINKLHSNTKNLEEKSYASASVYGVSSIDQLLPLVIARITETRLRIRKGSAGVNFKEIAHFLRDVEAEVAGAIACKVVFDQVFSTKRSSNQATAVCDAIGQAIENNCLLDHYEATCPGLLHTLKERYYHASMGTTQRVTVIKTMMNRIDAVDHWKCWGREVRVRLGGWLLDCVIEASGWFMTDLRQEGKKRNLYVIPTPLFIEIKDAVMDQAELFAPIALPMLIPPNDWSNERPGGYILNECMKGYPLVRRGNPLCIQGETPLKFLNHIQQSGFVLSDFIVDVAETLMEKGISVGKFIPVCEIPLPVKPPDIADNKEARKDYNRKAAEVHNQNAQAFRKSCRTRMTMNAVQRFKGRTFYHGWSLDYRGRAYPIASVLTPQSDDFGKSLLKFAEPSLMTERAKFWLKFNVSTTYGLDKSTMQERQDWAEANTELITKVATEPLKYLHEWEAASEPWQFLSSCEEMYHCVIKGDRKYTSSMVATDATCSGLQILAGMSGDKSTAELCNVIPSDKPQDAYKVVAEAAKPNCPESIRPYMDRKVVKKVVMTLPYNSKPYSNRSYIRDALKEVNVDIDKDKLTATVKAVRNAMSEIVPGPMKVMKWIEEEVVNALKRGATELKWVTPSGFVVNQRLNKVQLKAVELQLMGRVQIKVATSDEGEVDKNHHKNATSPNLIHSADASLLHLSAIRFNNPLALIHDSVLCRSTDVDSISALVRETYMHLFAEQDYLTDWAKQIGAETEPPIIGTLNAASVIKSTYFFC